DDALPLRAHARLNESIRELAGGREAADVYLADVERALEQDPHSPHGLTGSELFWEHAHLRFAGQCVAARTVLPTVEAALDLPARAAAGGLSDEKCAELLVETPFDRHRVAESVLLRTSRPPFTSQLDHEKRQEAQIQSLANMVVSRPELVRCARQYGDAVARRPDDWMLRANFAALLVSAGRAPEAEEQLTAVAQSLPGSVWADERLAAVP